MILSIFLNFFLEIEGHFAFDVLRKVTLLMVHLLGPEIEKVFIFNGG